MDFIFGLPKAKGFDSIMVVVDRLSKYAYFVALSHLFTAKDITRYFIQKIVRVHGFPKIIFSNRDPIFLSQFWSELFTKFGTKLRYSTSYHPQTDGQTKVVNQCLETYPHCFVGSKSIQWLS